MKILFLERNRGDSYSYYNEIVKSISSLNKVFLYQDWVSVNESPLDIREALKKCPSRPDIICFGFGWTDCGEQSPRSILGLEEEKIPVAVILNKEYAALDKKLEWIKDIRALAAYSVHHDVEKYQNRTGIPFCKIPFAANETVFKDYDQEFKYDFGFTGLIRPEQTNDWRSKIYEKSKEWDSLNVFFSPHQHDNMIDYAKRINSTKIWLSTTGPADIVGPRYYEVMISGTTLLACNRMKGEYDGLFEEGEHCIMFDSVEELEEKIHYYLSHEKERQEIIKRAQEHVLNNHTWKHRGQKFTKFLEKKLEESNG